MLSYFSLEAFLQGLSLLLAALITQKLLQRGKDCVSNAHQCGNEKTLYPGICVSLASVKE